MLVQYQVVLVVVLRVVVAVLLVGFLRLSVVWGRFVGVSLLILVLYGAIFGGRGPQNNQEAN